MQINNINSNINFNGIKFKSINDMYLLEGFKKKGKLHPKFEEIYNEQLNNPVHINIEASSNIKRLIFKVQDEIFKPGLFENNIDALEAAAKYANLLKPFDENSIKYVC